MEQSNQPWEMMLPDSISKVLLGKILEGIGAGVVVLDEKTHKILYVNKEIEKLSGYSAMEIVGQDCHFLLCPVEDENCPLADLGLTMDRCERFLINKHGKLVPIIKTTYPIQLENGGYIIESVIDDSMHQLDLQKSFESERSKSVILSNLQGMAYRCNFDRDWTIQYVSEGCKELTGYPPESLTQNKDLSYNDIIHPEYREILREESTRVVQEKQKFIYEYPIITAEGEEKWVLEKGQPIYNENGEVVCFEGLSIDITEQKIIEKRLIQSEEQFRIMFEKAPLGIGLFDFKSGKVLQTNKKFAEILGMTKDETYELDWRSISHPDDMPENLKYREQIVAGEIDGFSMKKRYFKKDGSIVWVNLTIALLDPLEKENPRELCMIEDITERKQMEMALRDNFNDLLESQRIAHVGTWRLDLATNQVVWSEELYKMYGFDPTIPPPPYTEHMKLFTPESWDKLSTSLEQTSTVGTPYELELKTVTSDGSNGWMWVRGEAVKDSHEKIVMLHGAAQDITARKQMEMKIRESEERFQMLFEKAPLGYQSLDSDGNFLEVNQKWLDIFGYQKEDVIGKWFGDFLAPEYKEPFRKRFPIFKDQGYIHSEFEMVGKTGESMFIAFDGKIGYAHDGAFQQTHCILKDITVERELATELAESRKLMEATLISVGDGVISCDIKGAIQFMNPVAERLTGWTQEEAKGQKIERIFHIINESTGELSESITKQVFESGNIVGLANHTVLISKSGARSPIEDCAAPIILESGEIIGVVVVFSDFSEKQKKLEEIEYLSYHDYLTGLYNRRFFEVELNRYDVARNLPLSIVMGDVNGLKLINDSFGHEAGDELLKRAGQLIVKSCRTDDVVARLGGDEFVILLPKSNESDAEAFMKRVQKELTEEKVEQIPLSVSFGFATKTHEQETMAEVLKSAEDHMYRHKLYENTGERSRTVNLIINTLYEKNHREMLHSKRVGELSALIATALGFNPDDVNQIKTAGLMHDIGKIGVEDSILNKVERLDESEWEEIKKHCEIGYRILGSVPEFSEIANFVLEHQEKWDGSGYPRGLKGDEISLESRIIAVADSFDAMTGERTYGRVFSKTEALEELLRCSATQFDPEIVEVFVKTMTKE